MSNVAPGDRATTIKAAYNLCDIQPLQGESLKYYVNLSAVRSGKAIERVQAQLEFLDDEETTTILFSGHRGCGKSTELRRIETHLRESFWVIYLETDAELDINDATYTDFYLVIIKRVADALNELGLQFDGHRLKSFENWFKEITEETEETVEKSISLEAGAEAGLEIPFISKLLTKLLAQIKGTNKQKRVIREKLDQDVSRLKDDINALLMDANTKLRQFSREMRDRDPDFPDYKGFLIIFDNLDRAPLPVSQHLFFDYSAQIQDLREPRLIDFFEQ